MMFTFLPGKARVLAVFVLIVKMIIMMIMIF